MIRKNIIAIVQARMGSTRLPGKVLMDIEGKPMLWHVVNRLGYAKSLKNIVVATTIDKRDDILEKMCNEYQINCFRGDENDVLDRYYQAAKHYAADIIVRVTSDCPLIDPCVVDKIVEDYTINANSFDSSSNVLKRTYPRGLDGEVVPFYVLQKIKYQAGKGYQREHVTVYMYENPDIFRIHNVENNENLSHFRWTVDEESDLTFVREIYRRLGNSNEIFLMKDVLGVLKTNPSIANINKNVRQKVITE